MVLPRYTSRAFGKPLGPLNGAGSWQTVYRYSLECATIASADLNQGDRTRDDDFGLLVER